MKKDGKQIFLLRQYGFTMLEILISLAVISTAGILVLVSFVNSRNIRDLTTSGQNVLSILRLAQSKSIGGENNAPWGVHLEQSQFVLFQGPTYISSPSVEVFTLLNNIEIVNIALVGGGQDVLFNRIDGKTNQSGTLDLRIKSSPGTTFPITIDNSGKVYQTGTAPASSNTRIVDTRHRTFDLNGTIKNSVTMTLTFSDPPNPDVVYPVTMSPMSPRTLYDWTGTVSVGGQDQTLRIHSLLISDTDTLLSVDHDCRKNNKKVKITFDTNDVATYEADCQTLNVWSFGGVATEP